MDHHTVELPETTYQWLVKQAAHLQLSPEQILERLIRGELALPPFVDAAEEDPSLTPADTAAALAAVERLTTLFADVVIPNFDEQLHDPMLALANIDLDDLPQ